MTQLTLAIVIPVYNDERYLAVCLDSIAAQNRAPTEVIVVNNNCTDDSEQIARRYPFVRVVNESRQGSGFAQQTGFMAARTTVIGRIDADTVLPPTWAADVLAAFETGAVAITGRGTFYDMRLGKPAGRLFDLGYYHAQRWLAGTYVLWGSNMAISAEVYRQVAADTHIKLGIDEDIDLSLVLKRWAHQVAYRPDLVVQAAVRPNKLTVKGFIAYTASWPVDYQVNGYTGRLPIVRALRLVVLAITLPYIWLYSLRSRDWIDSRRGRS